MKVKKILHVGWGFIPWRGGGLIEYAQDLMIFQNQIGWDVHYFFAGRKYPFIKSSYLKEWSFNNISCYEIINSPVMHGGDFGTRQPEMQLDELVSECFFRDTLQKVEPEIIHFHEFAGVPSSFIEIAKEFSIPTLMTLADYYLLCPTLKLFNKSEKNCRLKKVSIECATCCSNAPLDHRKQVIQTLLYLYKDWWIFRHAPRRALGWVLKLVHGVCDTKNATEIFDSQAGHAFSMRREVNLKRLDLVDQLVSRSKRVETIYREYLGEHAPIITINPHLLHIDEIKAQPVPVDTVPVHFVTLNGLVSVQKGGKLLLDAVSFLNGEGLSDRFVLHVYGGLGDEFRKQVFNTSNIVYHGDYEPVALNSLLSGKHVGLLPSVWEEVYGYVGPEMLAKGLPLIANKIGGITEYAVDGVNSILNVTCGVEEFKKHMMDVILYPEIIFKLNRNILSKTNSRDYRQHFKELNEVYSRLIACNRNI